MGRDDFATLDDCMHFFSNTIQWRPSVVQMQINKSDVSGLPHRWQQLPLISTMIIVKTVVRDASQAFASYKALIRLTMEQFPEYKYIYIFSSPAITDIFISYLNVDIEICVYIFEYKLLFKSSKITKWIWTCILYFICLTSEIKHLTCTPHKLRNFSVNFPQITLFVPFPCPPPLSVEDTPRKKATLYEDLRLKNRENYEVTLTQKAETLLKTVPEKEPGRNNTHRKIPLQWCGKLRRKVIFKCIWCLPVTKLFLLFFHVTEKKNIYGDTWEEWVTIWNTHWPFCSSGTQKWQEVVWVCAICICTSQLNQTTCRLKQSLSVLWL